MTRNGRCINVALLFEMVFEKIIVVQILLCIQVMFIIFVRCVHVCDRWDLVESLVARRRWHHAPQTISLPVCQRLSLPLSDLHPDSPHRRQRGLNLAISLPTSSSSPPEPRTATPKSWITSPNPSQRWLRE